MNNITNTVHGKMIRAFFILASDLVSAIGRGWIHPRGNETLSPIKVTAGHRSGTATVHHRKKQRTVNLNSKLGNGGDRLFFVAYADGHSEILIDKITNGKEISRVLYGYGQTNKFEVDLGDISVKPNTDFVAYGQPSILSDPLSSTGTIYGGELIILKDLLSNKVLKICSRHNEDELSSKIRLDLAIWLAGELSRSKCLITNPLDYLPEPRIKRRHERQTDSRNSRTDIAPINRLAVTGQDLTVSLTAKIAKPQNFVVIIPEPPKVIETFQPGNYKQGLYRKTQASNKITEAPVDRLLRKSIQPKNVPKKVRLIDLNLDPEEVQRFISEELQSRPAKIRNGGFFKKEVKSIPLIDTTVEDEDDGYRRNKKGIRIMGSRQQSKDLQSQLDI